jgi:hypothetical protein
MECRTWRLRSRAIRFCTVTKTTVMRSLVLSCEWITLTVKSSLPLDKMLTTVFRYVSFDLDWDLFLVRVV